MGSRPTPVPERRRWNALPISALVNVSPTPARLRLLTVCTGAVSSGKPVSAAASAADGSPLPTLLQHGKRIISSSSELRAQLPWFCSLREGVRKHSSGSDGESQNCFQRFFLLLCFPVEDDTLSPESGVCRLDPRLLAGSVKRTEFDSKGSSSSQFRSNRSSSLSAPSVDSCRSCSFG